MSLVIDCVRSSNRLGKTSGNRFLSARIVRNCILQARQGPMISGCTKELKHADNMANLERDVLLPLRSIVPQLTNEQHKGQSGRVAVFGGCKEYTGAPYFASISALKMGADLSHVFCTEGAAPVIKSYSPELIVHPILQESFGRKIDDGTRAALLQQGQEEIRKWMPSFKTIVIGPGLGRDPLLLPNIASVIKEARSKNLPMVIDGDGLFIVTNEPEIVQGYSQVVLTPNFNEYKRLASKILGNDVGEGNAKDLPEQVRRLAECMGVTIMKKGPSDIISDGITVVESDYFGSPRRCGGQGDVVAGCTGVFMTWARQCLERGDSPQLADLKERISGNPTVLGALSASILVRKAASKAFAKHRRGMVTTDLIEELAASMDELFPLC